MRSTRIVHIVECHAGGEVGDVVVGGVAPPPGETLWAQSRHLEADGRLKGFLLNEPRGGVFRHVNILTPPKDPRAAAGFVILEPATAPPMSGSNAMCVATVLLETGLVPMVEPETRFFMEAPGGLVEIVARCRNGRAEAVTLTNLPSFVDRDRAMLDVPGFGRVEAAIVFGGDSFVIVEAAALGFSLVPGEARAMVEAGMAVARAADATLGFSHPFLPGMNEVTFCLMAGPIERDAGGGLAARHAVAIRPGKLDRSPTGTGASARLALMHARGEIGIGEPVTFRSVLGSSFEARIAAIAEVAGRAAVIPEVTGRAYIMGTRQLMLDPDDPWPEGYRLSDTWPGA